jgi:hypothetical protein
LSADYDTVLNVIGIISLDENIESFVGVYRTTELMEISMLFTGIVDTNWWYERDTMYTWLDSLYEPAGVIDSAVVTIFNDIEIYTFEFDSYARKYKPIGFTPSEDTHYNLKIEVNGFDTIIGELITPIKPYLDTLLIEDTLSASSTYTINWGNNQSSADHGLLIGKRVDSNVWCGGEFYSVVQFESEEYTVFPEWCNPEQVNVGDIDNDYRIRTESECMCDNYRIWELESATCICKIY